MIMDILSQKIENFFKAYEQRFMDGLKGKVDVNGTIASFAECFMESSPVGVNCGRNDAKFREVIPKGYEFYKSIGTQSIKILSKEITVLDEFHMMCKVHWQSKYLTKDKKEEVIDFDVFYFLRYLNDELKIFAYITGDEQKVLKERGLV
jgi:hypothetical protein